MSILEFSVLLRWCWESCQRKPERKRANMRCDSNNNNSSGDGGGEQILHVRGTRAYKWFLCCFISFGRFFVFRSCLSSNATAACCRCACSVSQIKTWGFKQRQNTINNSLRRNGWISNTNAKVQNTHRVHNKCSVFHRHVHGAPRTDDDLDPSRLEAKMFHRN